MNRVWIVMYETGYDHDDVVDVFSTEQKAKNYIAHQIGLNSRSIYGNGSSGLYIDDYDVK